MVIRLLLWVQNRKLLIFGTDELPEMSGGRGVQLQKYRDAKLVDLKVFNSQDGLSWTSGKNRIRKEDRYYNLDREKGICW